MGLSEAITNLKTRKTKKQSCQFVYVHDIKIFSVCDSERIVSATPPLSPTKLASCYTDHPQHYDQTLNIEEKYPCASPKSSDQDKEHLRASCRVGSEILAADPLGSVCWGLCELGLVLVDVIGVNQIFVW